jgi:tetratricopeptide (TPR) repeat protein
MISETAPWSATGELPRARGWRPWIISFLLILLVAVVYAQTFRFGFLNFDDNFSITESPHVLLGLTPAGIQWAFGAGFFGPTPHVDYWRPLSFLSHMLDVQLFGLWAGGHHLENAALHAVNAVLVFLVLLSMTGRVWRCAMVAALFAVHPLHVESVAWISERKDVLCTLFFLLTLLAYTRYAREPSAGRYLLVFASLALGLLSKPMLVTTPFVLLLLDVWPLKRGRPWGRESWLRLIAEKIPLLVLSLIDILATFSAQRVYMHQYDAIAAGMRVGNALVSYVTYLSKTFFPAGLCVFHPIPRLDAWWPLWQTAGSGMILLAITIVVLCQVRRRPYLPVCWFWYLGMLVPVIGFVQVGGQSWADRYTYLPLLGIFVALVWLAGDWVQEHPRLRRVALTLAALLIPVLAAMSWIQTRHWRDDFSLWERVLAIHEDAMLPHTNYSKALMDAGRLDEAEREIRRAISLDPSSRNPRVNLGSLLSRRGHPDEAVAVYLEIVRMHPDDATAHYVLAGGLSEMHRYDEAVEQYREALRLDPALLPARRDLRKALFSAGRGEESIAESMEVLRRDPSDGETEYDLANLLVSSGRGGEALPHFGKAMRLDPRNPKIRNDCAWLLATSPDASVRDGRRALELALEANQLTGGKDAGVLDTLAAAYAENGDFSQALRFAGEALRLAAGDTRLEASLREEEAGYRRGEPYREKK